MTKTNETKAGRPSLNGPGGGVTKGVRARLTDEHLAMLDRIVARGDAPNRSAALRWVLDLTLTLAEVSP